MSTTTTPQDKTPSATRSYPSYSRPLWWRLAFTRESAVIALLVAVLLWAIYGVLYFGTQLTMNFLFLDIAPILLIALPMTAVIVTGEIDLSVASVVGLSSSTLGLLLSHGWSVPAAAVVCLL
ncbi:MAG: ATPase, partial [Nocardioidaceae bacterium]|nr:ATPase [Nocardioidaceae bacterium]